jgi:hypothetical protein
MISLCLCGYIVLCFSVPLPVTGKSVVNNSLFPLRLLRAFAPTLIPIAIGTAQALCLIRSLFLRASVVSSSRRFTLT